MQILTNQCRNGNGVSEREVKYDKSWMREQIVCRRGDQKRLSGGRENGSKTLEEITNSERERRKEEKKNKRAINIFVSGCGKLSVYIFGALFASIECASSSINRTSSTYFPIANRIDNVKWICNRLKCRIQIKCIKKNLLVLPFHSFVHSFGFAPLSTFEFFSLFTPCNGIYKAFTIRETLMHFINGLSVFGFVLICFICVFCPFFFVFLWKKSFFQFFCSPFSVSRFAC